MFYLWNWRSTHDLSTFAERCQYVAGRLLNLPPSISITLPVTYAPALLVRNRIAPAMSSSVPTLCRGILSLEKVPFIAPMMPDAISEGNTGQVSMRTKIFFKCSSKETGYKLWHCMPWKSLETCPWNKKTHVLEQLHCYECQTAPTRLPAA